MSKKSKRHHKKVSATVPPVTVAIADRGLASTSPFVGQYTSAPPIALPGTPRAGGRQTWDDNLNVLGGYQVILPPDQTSENWRAFNLDAKTIRSMSASRLLMILADVSPDVSRALWDSLRLYNPGYTAVAYKAGSEYKTPSKDGQVIVNAWLKRLRTTYGSADIPIGRIHFGGFLRGALMAEMVLDERGRTALDLATPDPATARFRRRLDPVLGQVWELGQFQGSEFINLQQRPTVQYVPIDPAPGIPYGRPPAAPALFSSLFLIGLLGDLRRVVAQQGYPRYDLVIMFEELIKTAPMQIRNDPTEMRNWVGAAIKEVQDAYNALEPDSAFVHTDMVVVNKPTGAVNADAMKAASDLIQALERMTTRGLKSMPLLMGMLEGSSEANANRQWELQAAGTKAFQHLSESMLGHFATVACEAEGIAAEVKWTFAELRAAERYRDAMTEALEIDNAVKRYNQGYNSQEQSSIEATDHAPDQSVPRFMPTTEQPYSENPESATASGDMPAPGGGTGTKPGVKAGTPKPAGKDDATSGEEKPESTKTKTKANLVEAPWRDLVTAGLPPASSTNGHAHERNTVP
jgi:hypothetical protein